MRRAPDELPYIDPGQLQLPGLGPAVGARYVSIHGRQIAVVLGVEQRRYGWITVRIMGERQTLRLDNFLRNYAPYHQPHGRQHR